MNFDKPAMRDRATIMTEAQKIDQTGADDEAITDVLDRLLEVSLDIRDLLGEIAANTKPQAMSEGGVA